MYRNDKILFYITLIPRMFRYEHSENTKKWEIYVVSQKKKVIYVVFYNKGFNI